MNSNWNWNHLIFGAVIAIGGVAYVYYKQKTKATLSFPDYCSECESAAEKELSLIDDNIKTILVLAKVDDQNVAPFLYKSCKDGKIRKKRVMRKVYPFDLCPQNIQESISKGEYIIKKY